MSDHGISEPGEVVGDSEVLPESDVQASDGPLPEDSVVSQINARHQDELSLNNEELRSQYRYGAAVGDGTTVPWQAYTVEVTRFWNASTSYGLFGGSGHYAKDGKIDDQRSYDIDLRSSGFGVSGRYFLTRFAPLSFQGWLGYANWRGTISPRGATDSGTAGDEDRISTSFTASGLFLGAGMVLSGIWENGFFLEWTPVGAFKSWISSKDITYETSYTSKVVTSNIEDAGLFGFANLKVGYYF